MASSPRPPLPTRSRPRRRGTPVCVYVRSPARWTSHLRYSQRRSPSAHRLGVKSRPAPNSWHDDTSVAAGIAKDALPTPPRAPAARTLAPCRMRIAARDSPGRGTPAAPRRGVPTFAQVPTRAARRVRYRTFSRHGMFPQLPQVASLASPHRARLRSPRDADAATSGADSIADAHDGDERHALDVRELATYDTCCPNGRSALHTSQRAPPPVALDPIPPPPATPRFGVHARFLVALLPACALPAPPTVPPRAARAELPVNPRVAVLAKLPAMTWRRALHHDQAKAPTAGLQRLIWGKRAVRVPITAPASESRRRRCARALVRVARRRSSLKSHGTAAMHAPHSCYLLPVRASPCAMPGQRHESPPSCLPAAPVQAVRPRPSIGCAIDGGYLARVDVASAARIASRAGRSADKSPTAPAILTFA
ncbi:hypothetical protein B0H15DRAFT_1001523 [Mycena belliarum]|uniref:Uncharacterized protein n=1 Tax=Mycena belliarum TaxID=1033014 RepID=A0AAD6TSP3_9AGAR|nr:hypothetical protein B0H15DRAFT_1001523 [Mycena belliae]